MTKIRRIRQGKIEEGTEVREIIVRGEIGGEKKRKEEGREE